MSVSLRLIRPNFTRVEVGPVTIWFSYETAIAFSYDGTETVRENDWGPTTGKHLNSVNPDKSIRVDGPTFRERLALTLAGLH